MATESEDHARAERGQTRRSREQRRAEIAEATLRVMTRYGLHGTTVSRIAAEVGMAPQSLYNHYENQNEMLLAAIDPLISMTDGWLASSSREDPLARLHDLGKTHHSFLSDRLEGFTIPAYQFLVADPDTGIPGAFGERHREQLRKVAAVIEEGQRRGAIRPDIDPLKAAWRLFVVAFTEDLAQLMEIPEFVTEGTSVEILDVLLKDLAPSLEE